MSALPFCDAPTVFIEGFRKFCYNEKSAFLWRIENEVKRMKLFTEQDYVALKQMEPHTETETYRGTVHDDLVIEVVHRRHRKDPSRMIYVVSLNHNKIDDLFNDDLYWRAEPAKFCHGLPPMEEIEKAIQKMLDFRNDVGEWKPVALNLTFTQPEFDS